MAMRLSDIMEHQKTDEPSGMRLGDIMSTERVNLPEYNETGLFTASKEQMDKWKGMGPIGYSEQAVRQDKTEMIPFNPEGAVKSVKLLNAVNRIRRGKYDSSPAQKDIDINLVNNFLMKSEEERVRGFTVGGRITQGVSALPGFMVEFLMTGGAASLGKKAVSTIAKKSFKKIAKKQTLKFATRTAGGLAGAVARTAVMPHRVVESFAQRQIDSGLELTDKGLEIAKISREKPFVSAMKAFGDVVIENFSEVTGPEISKVAGKVIPRKMANGLSKLWKRLHPGQNINRLFTKAGYNGFLEELGEERLGALLRAVTGVENFGADNPDRMFDRIIASVPNGEEMLVEAGVLAFPGALHSGAQQVSRVIQKRKATRRPGEVVIDEKTGEPIEIGKTSDAITEEQADEILGTTESIILPAEEAVTERAGNYAGSKMRKVSVDDRLDSPLTQLAGGRSLVQKQNTQFAELCKEKNIEIVFEKFGPDLNNELLEIWDAGIDSGKIEPAKPEVVPEVSHVSLEADPLIAEAKKYKTAEEFEKAFEFHGGPEKLEGAKLKRFMLNKTQDSGGIFLTPDEAYATGFPRTKKVYRGYIGDKKILNLTSKEGIEKVRKFIGKEYIDEDGEKLEFTQQDFDFMFPSEIGADWATFNENVILSMGYDGAVLNETQLGTKTTTILKGDVAVLPEGKTPTDIWKQAQGEKATPEVSPEKEPLIAEAKKYKTAEEFVGFMRGSATQYRDYNPQLRAKYKLFEDSARISELGVNPEKEITIYRGVPDVKTQKISDGDFITVDRLSAESYAGKENVVSKKVKAKDLITDSASEFDKNRPFELGAEFIYSDSKNKLIFLSDDQLTDIWKQAQGEVVAEKPPTAEIPKPPVKKPPAISEGIEGPEGEGKNLAEEYEHQKDVWFGEKDVRVLKSKSEKRTLQKEVLKALGKKRYDATVRKYDKAIQIYIDSKINLEHITELHDKLTAEQKELIDLSQNLPDNLKKVADKISQSYKDIGLEALESDVIRNVLDNYAARIWDIKKGQVGPFRKFGTTTRHAKQRKFETIIQGWSEGYNLKVEGATNNLQILKEEIVKTIEDKKFIRALQKIKTIDGEALISTKQLEGYTRIEHPNFKLWRYAGEAKDAKAYGQNFFVDEEGVLFERKELYAPEEQAKNLNNILGVSKLKDIRGIKTLTKYNAITKAWILQSSFFHHLAFMRSYYFGTNHKTWAEMSLRQAYRQGLEAIEQESPVVLLGVKNGLTLGIKQDWNEELLHEKTAIGNLLDKWDVSKKVKDKIIDLRERQANFLFGEFGAGLKAKAFVIEYRNMVKKHPGESSDKIAKMVANLINDDFGGLHLQRLGRNPTTQHIFRLFALAPDWTESNVRTMVKAFKSGSKAETAFYRKFWAGILTKGVLTTFLANLLLNWDDLEETYKEAWKQKNLRWLDVDITNIYKALGGETSNRKYFSIVGHFKDPIKFLSHPIRSAQHKGSVVYRFFHEALTGVDWSGRRFTTSVELFDKKKTVIWSYDKKGPLEYSQIPAFVLSQIKGWQPVQIQNLLGWIAGEMEGFDAIGKSLGLMVTTTYGKKKKYGYK